MMAKLALCVSVLLAVLVVPTESGLLCCKNYQKDPIPQRALKDYRHQDISFCNHKAVIFKTVKGLLLCGNPDEEWVKKAMQHIDQNRKKSGHHSHP